MQVSRERYLVRARISLVSCCHRTLLLPVRTKPPSSCRRVWVLRVHRRWPTNAGALAFAVLGVRRPRCLSLLVALGTADSPRFGRGWRQPGPRRVGRRGSGSPAIHGSALNYWFVALAGAGSRPLAFLNAVSCRVLRSSIVDDHFAAPWRHLKVITRFACGSGSRASEDFSSRPGSEVQACSLCRDKRFNRVPYLNVPFQAGAG